MRSRFSHIAEEVRRDIDELLSGVGILFRVFARGKDTASLKQKIDKNPNKYSDDGKRIQDAVGVRIALYFPDDIPIVQSILESKFEIDLNASTIDQPNNDQFSVTRFNLVFKLPTEAADNFKKIKGNEPLDATFEVQLRSILSEGWHEVEHDLRYKAKENWADHGDLSRVLNGIVATLETSEWNMAKVFEELGYRHYKSENWQGMLPSILRMRLKGEMSQPIVNALDIKKDIAKEILRINRASLLKQLARSKPKIPVTADNVILFWNEMGPRHDCLLSLTPIIIKESISNMHQDRQS